MQKIIGFGKTKQIVEHYLQTDFDCRNDDKYLTTIVRKHLLNGKDYIHISEIYKLPSQDNIKRIRARFNQCGMYLATDSSVRARRQKYQEVVKEGLGY